MNTLRQDVATTYRSNISTQDTKTYKINILKQDIARRYENDIFPRSGKVIWGIRGIWGILRRVPGCSIRCTGATLLASLAGKWTPNFTHFHDFVRNFSDLYGKDKKFLVSFSNFLEFRNEYFWNYFQKMFFE